MKKSKFLALLLAALLVLTYAGTGFAQEKEHTVKNIIYMIPDGGGINPFYLADAVKAAGGLDDKEIYPYVTKTDKGHLYMTDHLIGAIKTYCADSEVTDSAAAGTALSTGYKANSGNIGLDKDLKPRATILEICQKLGKKTGMVTTYDWSNATPASFSAHNESRSNNGILSEQTVNQDIDLILGVGFDIAGWGGIDEAIKRGYKIINNRKELEAASAGDRIWGNLEGREFPFDVNNTADTVTLKEMTEAALKVLANDENGFFLMVEGSRVDNGGHSNNAKNMIGDFLAFDEAFGAALNFAKGRDDTIIIACPDHDTGGMILPDDLTEAVSDIRKGVSKPESIGWSTTGHTSQNGELVMYIPDWLEYPKGIDPKASNPFESNVIDNTDIIPYITDLLGADRDECTKELFVDVTDMGTYDIPCGLFLFSDYPAAAKRNASYAFLNDSVIDLGGEVCVYANGRFYVPQKLLDIINGKAEPVIRDDENIINVKIDFGMDEENRTITSFHLQNYLRAELSGYIEISSPENLARKLDFTLSSGEAKTISFETPDADINGFTCDYSVTLENGKTYSASENVGGLLYAAYTDTPVKIDGVIDDEQWKKAPKVVCDDVSMTIGMDNWKGFRDLSSVFAMLYDEDNLYFYSVVTDEIFCQEAPETSMWDGDSIQLGIYNDVDGLFAAKAAGAKFEGITFGYLNGKAIGCRSKRAVKELVEMGVISGGGFEFECTHVGDDLTYEIKMPWKTLFGYDLDTDAVKMLAFSYLLNDNDGEGRHGAIQYGGGLYGTKDINQFLKLYLVKDDELRTEDKIWVYYNDEKLELASKPFLRNNRTMIAVNEFLDKIGVEYSADEEAKSVTVSDITVGGDGMTVGGEKKELDVEPFFANNIVFAPIRALCEAMGKTVDWQPEPFSVIIR